MPASPLVQALLGLTVLICLFAFLKGGRAERIGAGIILSNLVLTIILAELNLGAGGSLAQLGLDAVTAIGLLVIALRYASLWVGAVMLLYSAQFGLHSFYIVAERPHDFLHIVLNNLNFLSVSICLAIGTVTAWRRRAIGARAASAS